MPHPHSDLTQTNENDYAPDAWVTSHFPLCACATLIDLYEQYAPESAEELYASIVNVRPELERLASKIRNERRRLSTELLELLRKCVELDEDEFAARCCTFIGSLRSLDRRESELLYESRMVDLGSAG